MSGVVPENLLTVVIPLKLSYRREVLLIHDTDGTTIHTCLLSGDLRSTSGVLDWTGDEVWSYRL